MLSRSVGGMRYTAGLVRGMSSCEQEFVPALMPEFHKCFCVPEDWPFIGQQRGQRAVPPICLRLGCLYTRSAPWGSLCFYQLGHTIHLTFSELSGSTKH